MAGSFLQDALIYLGTALVCVPVSKKLGIGSVLGYLIGGILVGPFALGLIGEEGKDAMHTAEFGVVMMLFVIGLEINPKLFWKMRKMVVGLGGSQVLLTALALFLFLHFGLSLTLHSAIALSLTFSLSSTAIVMQTLTEKGLDNSPAGRSSFVVLLLQDVAVIPILAVLPLLAVNQALSNSEKHLPGALHFLEQYPSLLILLAVVFVFLLSRYLLPRVLRLLAKINIRELFTAAALFFVIGIAWLMESAGVSAALGAFMAGVLLATSEFRHELEADINPFKGLLLGIFFTAVGSTVNFDVITGEPLKVMVVVVALMTIKWAVLFVLGRVSKMDVSGSLLFAFLLSQIGEFAFVLLGATQQLQIVSDSDLGFYTAVVTISMIVSPLFLFVYEKWIAPKITPAVEAAPKPADEIDEKHEVILIGFSDFGSIIGRFLRANKIHATIIDFDSDRVSLLRKMGFTVFYGDGTRLDLLTSAGAAKARVLVSAIKDPDKNRIITDTVQKHFPHLKVYLRANSYPDAFESLNQGATHVYLDALHSSVNMATEVLYEFGFRKYTLLRKAQNFIQYDRAAMFKWAKLSQSQEFIGSVREEIAMQEELLHADSVFLELDNDNIWNDASMEQETQAVTRQA